MESIHTLNTRDNVLIECAESYFSQTPSQTSKMLQDSLSLCVKLLKGLEIDYYNSGFKNSLIPNHRKQEAAFIFDSKTTSFYGAHFWNLFIPLLDKNQCCSILHGDFLDKFRGAREVVASIVKKTVIWTNQYYIIYINNHSEEMIKRIDKELRKHKGYVKYVDTSYSSLFKLGLSLSLCSACVKYKNFIIQSHTAGDYKDIDEVNYLGYDFEENGYTCKSIRDDLFYPLLSYKIERPTFPNEECTRYALTTFDPQAPSNFSNLIVEEAKLDYLKATKGQILQNAGFDLSAITTQELKQAIWGKLQQNYIYNITKGTYNNGTTKIKFNTIIEVKNSKKQFRVLVSLEYLPGNKEIRLVTLF